MTQKTQTEIVVEASIRIACTDDAMLNLHFTSSINTCK